MYVPARFQEKELDAIHQLVRDHSFGMLMVNGDQVPEVSRLPLHLKTGSNEDRILRHLALANPQASWMKMVNLRWLFFQESILIFHPDGTLMKIRFQPGIIRLSMPMEH